ncbi:glycosyl transferase group 1 [Clostridium sp. CAG:762]|nr:glycosyl transferase group 1 [Clostridium sp. CAG:762]
MRIGIFTDTYPPFINGVSTSIVMLKKALEKQGHTVYIVTVNNENMKYKYEEDEKVIRIPGIPVGIYDYRLTGIYPVKIVNKIRKWHLDVIHSQTEFGVGTFARIIAKQFHIPLVHTYHTMYEDYVHYITKGYFVGTSKKIVEYLTLFYCDKTISELIVPTEKTKELFKEKYKVNRNVYVIPTGIEIEKFYLENNKNLNILEKRNSLGIAKDDFVILFVGRIGTEKNIDLLLNGMEKLIKLSKKIKLLIIGDGPDMGYYKEYVYKRKLGKNVIFTGKVPWDSISEYYLIADIFATASVTETQGLTVIEAMAAGLPVVCINDESFTGTIMNNVDGIIFNNLEEYIEAITKLYQDRELLKNLGKKARIDAEKYSSEKFATSVLEVYRTAIKKNRKIVIPLVDTIKEVFKEND